MERRVERVLRSIGVPLIGVYLIGVHFMGVPLVGVHFMGVPLVGVHLMGVPLIGVAYRPHFGGDSQARTLQLAWASWRETQVGRDQLERFSWTGTSYSHEIGTRPTEFSHVYKYQLITQVE
jgi:hypothetical protein